MAGHLTRREMNPVLTFQHFDPEGKHKTKRLSLAINGRASVCLLIAPLEVQWDSFTVDGADNKPWPPPGVILNRFTHTRCLFICRPWLRAAVKYSSIIPRRESDENKRCSTRLLTEKKRWIPTSSSLQKDLAGGFSHSRGSDCFLNGLLTLLLQLGSL